MNAVAPGLIETRWIAPIKRLDEFRESWKKETALHKVLSPDDVAEAIVSFVTSMSLVTGQTVIVDGGWRM